MNKSPPSGIGIDVSKDALHIALRYEEQDVSFEVENTREGIHELWRKIEKYKCKIVMESTGRYHLPVAFFLSQKGLDVRVVNPITAKRYICASVRKTKTDKADAKALADMAALHRALPDSFCATRRDIQIRQKMGLLCSLEKQLSSMRLMMQNYSEFQESMNIKRSRIEYSVTQAVEKFDKQRHILEKEIEALVLKNENMQEKYRIAVSIPGISPFVGSLLCQILQSDCISPKQWIAFLGLNIPPRESGTWRGKSKLSKRGNAYLRKRIYSAAWGAVMNYDAFRSYYDKLKSEGKCHVTALLIVARKLLRILHACQRDGVMFSAERCAMC